MAEKEKTIDTGDEGILVKAAKAIGTAAGKVAKLAGATAASDGADPRPSKSAISQKIPKLAKKNKQRLPRKEKKALKKALLQTTAK